MFVLLASAALAAAPPASNPQASGPDSKVKSAEKNGASPSKEDFAKMMKLFDKMFPAQPDPDPARLAGARPVALAMWPDGTYAALFETMAGQIGESVLNLKPSELEMLADEKDKDGKAKAAKTASQDISLRDQMRREDPHFDRRLELITAAVRKEFDRLSPLIEPPLREGLARALARRFTAAQLTDIGAFYASPTGRVYAQQSIKVWFDGDIARSMLNSVPTLVMHMPKAMERVQAADDTLPPVPKKPAAKTD